MGNENTKKTHGTKNERGCLPQSPADFWKHPQFRDFIKKCYFFVIFSANWGDEKRSNPWYIKGFRRLITSCRPYRPCRPCQAFLRRRRFLPVCQRQRLQLLRALLLQKLRFAGLNV